MDNQSEPPYCIQEVMTLSNPKFVRNKLTIALCCFVLSACSTGVSINRQAISTTLINERGNIITTGKLSDTSSAALRIAGVDETACFMHFDDCILKITTSVNDKYSPNSLALFAELHYRKARELYQSLDCQRIHNRPPLNPDYANAPLDAQTQKQNQELTLGCLSEYQNRLNASLKYSYAYLFYDDLTTHGKYGKKVHLPNELDIQTLDIYRVTSNELINNLYNTTQNMSKKERINETNILTTLLNPTLTYDPIKLKTTHKDTQVKIMEASFQNTKINVYLPISFYRQTLEAHKKMTQVDDALYNSSDLIENLIPTAEIRLSGLNSISKRQGFGLSYVAQLKGRYTNNLETFFNQANDNTPLSRIHDTGQVLLSGYVQPSGHSLQTILDNHQFDVHLYNPYSTQEIEIFGKKYPLMANFSAGYATWLAENRLSTTSYANMLSQRDEVGKPQLYMLEPYDPNKRVIIMIHGLASSPATWIGVTNDIFNDSELRDHYQVWQVFYPTNIPMIENRYQIQQLIDAAFIKVDPTHQTQSSQHSVIISHSMGGIISRMMLSNNNLLTRLNQLTAPALPPAPKNLKTRHQKDTHHNHQSNNIREMMLSAYSQDEVEERFKLSAIPQVDRAIFINAPFRGTEFADRWFTRALRKIIHLPVDITQTIYGNFSSQVKKEELEDNPLGALFLQNGASQLSNQSSFMQLTNDLDIDDDITFHTIIASNDDDLVKGIQHELNNANTTNKDKTKVRDDNSHLNESSALIQAKPVEIKGEIAHTLTENMSDGIVPYKSSHLKGAKSETILSGGHGIHNNPETILILRNILHEHLQQYPIETD